MFFGSTPNRLSKNKRALSKYSVGSQEPGLAFDFVDNVYQKDQNKTVNFDGAITHSRSGNAVMTDGYGPELVTNGGFDSDISGWEDTGLVSSYISGGLLGFTSTAAGQGAYQSFSTTTGKTYIATVKLVSKTANGNFRVGNGSTPDAGIETVVLTSTGLAEIVFIAESSTSYIYLRAGAAGTFEWDNVSVREMPVLKWAPHNLLSYSEDFSNAAWAKSSFSVVADDTTAPNGTATADKITTTGTAGSVQSATTLSASVSHTFVCYAKYVDNPWIRIARESSAVNAAWFNIQTGVAGTVTDAADSSSITDVGNGWYRLELVMAAPTSSSQINFVSLSNADNSTTMTSGKSAYIWGAHVYRSDLGGMVDNPDQPASRASYVPTTSSAVYLPRVGHHVYNGSAWVNEGLLAESEARTNLLNRSQDFSNAYWAKNDTATLSLDSLGPDGQTNSAVKLIDDSSTGSSTSGVYVGRTVTVDTSSAYTFSVYAKKDQLGWVSLVGTGFTTPAVARCYFDLDSGVIDTTQQVGLNEATMQDVGNGWYRCAITFTTDSTDTSGDVRIYVGDSAGGFQVDLDGTSSILIYGAQFEKGSTPSSLIPTSGSSVTRAAESFTIPSANLPWPEPSYIGSELVTNGAFDTDSDWTLGTGWSIGSGVVSRTAQSGTTTANQSVSFVAGKIYAISYDLTVNAGTFRIRIGGGTLVDFADKTASGSYTEYLVARSGNNVLNLRAVDGAFIGSVDNISVREIDPLSVSIAMDGRMTYADEDSFGTAVFVSWNAGSSKYIINQLNTNGTNIGRLSFAQSDGVNYDQSPSSNVYTPDILIPFDIASRHGSTFVNGAVDGIALTANTTPVALPDLSTTDLNLAYNYMGTISSFRIWDRDIGDDGIVEATNPSLEPSLSLTFEGTGTNSFTVSDWSE